MKSIFTIVLAFVATIGLFAGDYVNITSMTPKELNAGDQLTLTGTYELTHPDKGAITSFSINLNHYDGGWHADKVIHNAGAQYTLTDFTGSDGTFEVTITIPTSFPDKNTLGGVDGASSDLQFFQAVVFYGGEETRTDFSNTTYGDLHVNNANVLNIEDIALSTPEAKTVDAKLYPNPVSQGAVINVAGDITENAVIDIYSATGAKVKSVQATASKTTIAADLAPGLYTVCIIEGNSKVTKKLIVK